MENFAKEVVILFNKIIKLTIIGSQSVIQFLLRNILKNLECSGLLTNCRTIFINLSKFILRLNDSYQKCLELFIIGFQRLHLLFFSKLRFFNTFWQCKKLTRSELVRSFFKFCQARIPHVGENGLKKTKNHQIKKLGFFSKSQILRL